MAKRQESKPGMLVRSSDGRKLENIIRCNDGNFQIEKVVFFSDEYLAAYEEVEDVQGGEARLKRGVSELRPLDPLGPEGTGLVDSEQELERWTEERVMDQRAGEQQDGGRKAG